VADAAAVAVDAVVADDVDEHSIVEVPSSREPEHEITHCDGNPLRHAVCFMGKRKRGYGGIECDHSRVESG
jgi:hypothetical protein